MTPEELERFGERVKTAPRVKALQGLDGDSDTAAQAVELEKSTGTPAQTIYGYNDNFVKDYKSFLTERMLDRNPGLAGYIEAHPMAAIVSKDDWNRMADFYDHLDYWMGAKSFNIHKAILGGLYGAQEKFRESLFAPLSEPSPEDAAAVGPYVTEAWKGFKAPIETGIQAFSALIHGVAGFGEGMALASGATPTEARMQGRRFGAAAEYFTTDLAAGGGHLATPTGQVLQKALAERIWKLGEPYLKAGELPPPGVHPVWDGVVRAEVERKMSVYDALVDIADKADTKAKSPDLMEIAAAVKVGNEQLYIHWDAVQKLYGEKMPEAGDGLFGDVPGFIEQYKNAIETATDVQIPLATWISKIDPDIVKELHDDIRFRPGDPTLREVEAFPKLEQAVEDLAKPPEPPPPITPEQMQDAGFTDSEIRYGLSEQQQQQVREGHGFIGGEFRKITPEDLAKAQAERAKALEEHAKRQERFNTAVEAVKDKGPREYPKLDMMPGDWGAMGYPATKEGYIQAGQDTLDQMIKHDRWNADRLERILSRTPAVEEAPLERLSRLKIEYADRLATHGALEHAPTKEGNLLQSLAAVTGKEYVPDNVSAAVRWAFLNKRPDIVERALELALRSEDAQLHARLGQELENLNKYADAQNAVNREMANNPLGWETAGAGPKFPEWDELLRDPNWKKISELTGIRVAGDLTVEETMIRQAIGVLFERLGGPQAGVRLLTAREVRMGETPYPATASYVMAAKYGADVPTITILLGSMDPAHNLGHEFMHHLKRYGFLTEKEWAILSKRAESEWIDKYRIKHRGYDLTKPDLIKEEGVAEGFGEWYSNRFIDDPEIHTIFQKIADFIDQLRVALKEFFGRDLTAEEIFEKIYRGEVARRTDIAGPDPKVQALPLEREAAMRPEIEVPDIEAEGLLGILPKGREQRYLNLINKQRAGDLKKQLDQAYKEEVKRQKPEWQKNYADTYARVIEDLKNRPDFRAAAFFRSGIISGQKLEGLPKLDPGYVHKDLRAALPEKWFRQRDSLAPDDIAGYLGYRTGDEMIRDLIRFEEARGRVKSETFLDLQAAAETERIMERQYGNLDENILREVREHAIGIERFDMLHEETLKLAAELGQQFTFSKQNIRDQAAHKFNETINSQVKLIKYTREIGKSNRAAEDAWLKGDALGAYVERQRTLRLQALAELAKKFEKEQAQFVRNRNRYKKREVGGRDPEFTNWVHHILNRVGDPVRDPTDLAREIAAHTSQDLGAFLKEKSGEAWLPEGYEHFQTEYLQSIPVWEKFIEDPNFTKHIDAMTVGEFRAVNESIKALDAASRKELTGYLEGQAFDRQKELNKMTVAFQATMINKLPPIGDPTTWQQMKSFVNRMKVSLIQQEYIWGRLDQTPHGGLFYKHFTKPFAQSGNEYRLLIAEYGKKLNQIKKDSWKGSNPKELIKNDVLFEPRHGLPEEHAHAIQEELLGKGYLNRAQFRGVMLNLGGDPASPRSNISKLARGYHAKPEEIIEWVNRHATQQDWDYVKKVWSLFDEIQGKDDIIAREMSGVAPARLPPGKINTPFGEVVSGYYPMVYDQQRGGGGKAGKVDPDLPSGIKVLTDRGWEIQRTSYAGPVSLQLGQIENQLTRRLRNIAFREVIEEAQRFFRSAQFQHDMTRHLGPEYTKGLIPYLRDIAGIRGPIPEWQGYLERGLNYVQQNAVVTLVGLNPGTIVKHNLTAFAQSFKEVKDKRYLVSAAYDLFMSPNLRDNHKFIMEGDGNLGPSAEIKGRRPNWMEALGGETDAITGEQTIRSKVAHVTSWPIAWMDQMISKWLYYAKYNEMMDEFLPKMTIEEAHGQAQAIADQAVRRTHGSTAITSRPAAMRVPLLKPLTALYGFFNHIYNRMYEISWEARKHKDLQTGEATRADVSHIVSQIFFALVPAALVEEFVTPLFDKDDRSLLTRFAMSLGFPIGSSTPIIRELMHGIWTGHDPSFGILQSSMKAITDVGRLIQKGPDPDKFGDQLMALHTLTGMMFGRSTQQIGRWNKFAYNYFTGRDQPQGREEWVRALRYGTSKERRH